MMGFDTSIIEEVRFSQSFKGYDTDEVDEFLDELVIEIEKLNQQIDILTDKVHDYETREAQEPAPAPVVQPEPQPVVEPPKPVEIPQPTPPVQPAVSSEKLKDMEKILADTLVNAQVAAERVVHEARQKAQDIIDQSESQALKNVNNLKSETQRAKTELATVHTQLRQFKDRYKQDLMSQIQSLDNIVIGDDYNDEGNGQMVFNMPDTPEEPVMPTTPQQTATTDPYTTAQDNGYGNPLMNGNRPPANPGYTPTPNNNYTAPQYEQPTYESPNYYGNDQPQVDDDADKKRYIEQALSAYDGKNDHPAPNLTFDATPDDTNGQRPEEKPMLTSLIDDIRNREE